MTKYIEIEQVVYLHDQIIEYIGGRPGVRDFTLLHSAVERCKATFAGQDLYPDIYTKAAALWHSITMNHAFYDGNKRTGYESMKRFLYINGYEITADKDEIVRMCVSIDNDNLEIKVIIDWLKVNTQRK